MTCLGIGGTGTGVAERVSWKQGGKISLTVARIGSGVLGVIVGLATLGYCNNLANSTRQSEIDTANAIKEAADRDALDDRDECRRTTNL